MTMNGYSCLRCATVQDAAFGGFTCPDCGGNLEVTYDLAAAAEKLESGLGSGARDIFRYAPFLPLTGPWGDFPLRIGGTPLYRAGRLGASAGLENIYLKDDTANPSASLKDRASAVALCRALETGAGTVAVASTGNAGSSLACLAAALGVPAVVFVPASAPPAKLTQMQSYGARVLAVKGNYDQAYDLCLEACEAFGWSNRSTGVNPFTREGKKTWSFEVWEALGRRVPDRVVVPAGDGNIISAAWKGWRELHAAGLADRVPKLDCAQSSSSDAICRTVNRLHTAGDNPDWHRVNVDEVEATTIADSISVNRPRDGLAAVRAVMESGGEAVSVPDEATLSAIHEVSSLAGVFPEPAGAVAWAAVRHMADQGVVAADERIVVLVSGSGLKDTAAAGRSAPPPLHLEPDLGAVEKALAT